MLNDAIGTAKDEPAAAAPLALVGQDDFDRDVWCVLGLPFDRATLAEAADAVTAAARTGRRLAFITPNTNYVVRALRDPEARAQILDADLSLVDGAPIVAVARLLGVPLPERTAGSDLFDALRARPAVPGRRMRIFFFGGRDGAAEAAAAALSAAPDGLECAGHLNPGHGDVESMSRPEILDEINAARPDFVVVSLGAVKGEAWIARNKARLGAPVVAHLGAVVDFTAGTIRRAPAWVAKAGLEWAWRIKEERSLVARYINDGKAFARIFAQAVAPQFAAGRAPRRAHDPADATPTPQNGRVIVRLSGVLTHDALTPVRRAFRAAAAARMDVELDFAAVEAVDRAFLGLVLMLEKAAKKNAVVLAATGLSPNLRKLFAANGMRYPQDPGGAGPARIDEAAA